MKKINKIFVPFVVVLTDFIFVILTFFLSFLFRYGKDIPEINFKPFKQSVFALAFIYILAFALVGLFQRRFRSHWEVFRKALIGLCLGTLFSFVFFYIFRVKLSKFPSGVFLIVVPTGTILIFLINVIIFRVSGLLKTHLIVIGENKTDNIVINRSRLETYQIDNIQDILLYKDIDEVVICDHIQDDSQLNLLIFLLNKLRINVSFSPGLYAELLSSNIEKENSLRFLATSLGRKSDHEEFFIRLLDIFGTLFLLFLTFFPMLVFGLLIKLTSKGPVFYKQQRAGKDGKIFNLYKFRTMVVNAEENTGPVLTSQKDRRVTPLGHFLRKTRIDELPQIFNVLRGQMSLVGPRPERLYFLKLHKALRGIRLAVKPGITGLAQVQNAYDLKPKHKIKYDYLYIQKRSLLLNCYILLKTVGVVLTMKGW
ncbi:MAG: sugar transferase [Planctomycetes bacterium]|nr:sugar transferase [Planctomycetota bacterium]